MKICLLSSDPTAAIQLLYVLQAGGFKASDVLIVGADGPSFKILKDHAARNSFRLSFVDDPNSESCLALLREIAPDILKIQLGTIVRKPLLGIPRIGTLNTHAAVLPRYRGVDTPEWAILEGGDVGVSVHFVDAGVDTGPIVATRLLPLRDGDSIASILTRNHYETKWQTVLDALRLISSGTFVAVPQRKEDGRTHFAMHPKIRAIVEEKLRVFGARRR